MALLCVPAPNAGQTAIFDKYCWVILSTAPGNHKVLFHIFHSLSRQKSCQDINKVEKKNIAQQVI